MSVVYELTEQPIGGGLNVEVTSDVFSYRLVNLSYAQSGAGEKVLGRTKLETHSGKPAAIDNLGILIVEAGGTVTPQGKVESDALGRAVDHTTGEHFGYALTGATTAGQRVLVAWGI